MAITPGYYVFTATERSVIASNAPTLPAITAALRPVRLYYSEWVGPQPRVTRRPNPTALRMFVTQITWLVRSTTTLQSLSTYALGADAAAGVSSTLVAALNALGNFTDVKFMPYDPDVNGTVGWWESGAAATSSLTRDGFSQTETTTFAGVTAPPDNPMGPTTRGDHPTTILEGLSDARDAAAAGIHDAAAAASQAAADAARNAANAAKAGLWEAEKAALTIGAVATAVVFGPTVIPPLLAWLRKRFPPAPPPSRR